MLTVLKIVFPLIMREQRVFCFNKRKIHTQGLYQEHQIIKMMFKDWGNYYQLINVVTENNKIREHKKEDVLGSLKVIVLENDEQESA